MWYNQYDNPPRLPEQPIFYPVLNEKYASKIASGWNVKYNEDHQELWVPAEELVTFNRHIIGKIQVICEYSEE